MILLNLCIFFSYFAYCHPLQRYDRKEMKYYPLQRYTVEKGWSVILCKDIRNYLFVLITRLVPPNDKLYWFAWLTYISFIFTLIFIRILQWGEDRRFDDKRDNLGKLAIFWILQVLFPLIQTSRKLSCFILVLCSQQEKRHFFTFVNDNWQLILFAGNRRLRYSFFVNDDLILISGNLGMDC